MKKPESKFANNLRTLRKARRWTQAEVAEMLERWTQEHPDVVTGRLGVTQANYQRLESGAQGITEPLARALSSIFQVSMDELISVNSPVKIAAQKSDQLADVLQFKGKVSSAKHNRKSELFPRALVSHIVTVHGVVEAGAWREMNEFEEVRGEIYLNLPEFAGIEIFSHEVAGTSMDMVFPAGWTVEFASPYDVGIQQNDYVIVRRRNSSGLYEITVKQYVENNGKIELWPRSFDQKWQTPIIPPPRDEWAQEGFEIYGVVLTWHPPRHRRSGVPAKLT